MFIVPFLTAVGAVTFAVYAIDSLWSLFELISSHLMKYFLPTEVLSLTNKFGTWAAITGSTDGIGKHYAMELAQKGINVVLISRNPDKLKSVAGEIEKSYNVKTKIIVADFSKGTDVYRHIEEELKDIPLGILVNNVGMNIEYPTRLCEVPTAKVWELVNVNVVAVTTLTRQVLPGMVARGRGAVVNVSSGTELQPMPLMAVYGATKAYIRNFTHAVREEYSQHNIHIQHLSPMFVTTKMNAFSQRLMESSVFVPDAASYARQAVATLGRVQNTTGYWTHGLQYFLIKLAPEWIRMKVAAQMAGDFRKEYMTNLKAKDQ